jgi:hypothetical protein
MQLFQSLFRIATQEVDVVTEMANFIKQMPWDEISKINDPSASWFKQATRNRPSTPSTSAVQEVMEKSVDDAIVQSSQQPVPKVAQPNIPTTHSQENASSNACVEQDARPSQGDEMAVDNIQAHAPLSSNGREPSTDGSNSLNSAPNRAQDLPLTLHKPSSQAAPSIKKITLHVRPSEKSMGKRPQAPSPLENEDMNVDDDVDKAVRPSEKSKGKRPRPTSPLEEEDMDVDENVDNASGPQLRPRIKKLKESTVTKVTPPGKKKGTKAHRRHPSGGLMDGTSPSEPIDVDNLFVSIFVVFPYAFASDYKPKAEKDTTLNVDDSREVRR